jgi:hypothetical protein
MQGELAACQRYYYRQGGTGYIYCGTAVANSATAAVAYIPLPVTMRIGPTVGVDYSAVYFYDPGANVLTSATSITLGTNTGQNGVPITITAASGMTQFRAGNIVTNSGYIGLTAEL